MTSINIIRDSEANLRYFVTPNAVKTSQHIFENFDKGYHSFNIIGSFGTGKSSFLWALERSLKKDESYFDTKFNGRTDFLKIVGDYQSLRTALYNELDVKEDLSGNQMLFNKIYERYEKAKAKNGLLVIAIDEFGKFLEYAAKNNSEEELYFLQKLAEFINEASRNIILITTLHQNLESYAYNLEKAQIQEWRKVKGRFIDLTFNEPVEQLILLASKAIDHPKGKKVKHHTSSFIKEFDLFSFQEENLKSIESNLFPLSAISAYSLANSLQRYGQNERSLFTFLNSITFSKFIESGTPFELPEAYDYLFEEFYGFITSKNNPDYTNWASIKNALERAELLTETGGSLIQELLKSIGLLNIFAKKSAKINHEFFLNYFSSKFTLEDIENALLLLQKNQIIRFSKFNKSFKLFEGTDLDIEGEISKAENKIGGIDILKKLSSHFDFPVIIAKSTTYRTGTPRLFQFLLSDEPIFQTPKGQIDGFINLIFTQEGIDQEKLCSKTSNSSTLSGYFTNTAGIFETLFEIEKTNEVLKSIQGEKDLVAIRELKSIIRSNEILLNHYVMNSLYTNRVKWFCNGQEIQIDSKQVFNQALSTICFDVYSSTPNIQNELINRHKTSGSISSARKSFWTALTNNFHLEDLGFPKDKWPAEKTIYYSLLKKTGIHREIDGIYTFSLPADEGFHILWNISMDFLNQTKSAEKRLIEFNQVLSSAPLKLKQGIIDFWVPTFLFIKRGDFALFNSNGFVPYLDETILHMMTRNPKEFSIKSFELNELRLNLFNKYRDLLRQENKNKLDTDSFIESIRPLLIFYRDLTDYSQNTLTVSPEAVKLREAISKAKDPEKTFFEAFPESLGYSLKDLGEDNSLFEDYVFAFQNAIEEIKNSYSDLLDRFELFICDEILGEKLNFENYKNRLQNRFRSIKEHQALTRHKILLLRINSNLDDRDSYLMSLAQALLGKPLNTIKDPEERMLKDKFFTIARELDNLTDLDRVRVNDDDFLMKLQLTTAKDGGMERILRLNPKQRIEVEKRMIKLSESLDNDGSLKIPILVALLKKELDKDEEA
ncbi:MAG TPA: AAA family ATPase [Leeuwenhoekiella sp.]|nr:AAA family ATPase [Leeuwenhoekiella sp.]